MSWRAPVMLGVALLVLAIGVLLGGASRHRSLDGHQPARPEQRAAAMPSPADAAPPRCPWRQVLESLDRQRAAAWYAGDPAALTDVFAPGSVVLARDRAKLSAYTARGLRVLGVRTVYVTCTLVGRAPGRVVLDVIDRLDRPVVVARDGTRRALPRDQATRHRVTLLRLPQTAGADGWRIAAITLA